LRNEERRPDGFTLLRSAAGLIYIGINKLLGHPISLWIDAAFAVAAIALTMAGRRITKLTKRRN
jgi:hypothetical protein